MTATGGDKKVDKPVDGLIQNLRPTRARHFKKGPLAVAKTIVGLFSKVEPRNKTQAGLPSSKSHHGRFITIGPSHYCEKARWGLDYLENDATTDFWYSEDSHAPAFASFFTVPAAKDKASQTPMLIFNNNGVDGQEEMIHGSEEILRKLCPFLYPTAIDKEVAVMEKELGQRLGVSARLYAYHNLLHSDYYPALCHVCTGQISKVEAVLFEKMLPHGLAVGIRKAMDIHADNAVIAQDALVQVFASVSKRLVENGGKYIMDSPSTSYGFTAVDMTFAALASPLIRPPELAAFQCDDSMLPPGVVAFCQELKDTVAGQHVLRMYAEHRFGTFDTPEKSDGRLVTVRNGPRDRFPWLELGVVTVGTGAVAFMAGKWLLR